MEMNIRGSELLPEVRFERFPEPVKGDLQVSIACRRPGVRPDVLDQEVFRDHPNPACEDCHEQVLGLASVPFSLPDRGVAPADPEPSEGFDAELRNPGAADLSKDLQGLFPKGGIRIAGHCLKPFFCNRAKVSSDQMGGIFDCFFHFQSYGEKTGIEKIFLPEDKEVLVPPFSCDPEASLEGMSGLFFPAPGPLEKGDCKVGLRDPDRAGDVRIIPEDFVELPLRPFIVLELNAEETRMLFTR